MTKVLERNDPTRWAHPELVQAWEMATAMPPDMASWVDPDVPFEDRKKLVDDIINQFNEMMAGAPMPEGLEEYEVSGCEEEPDAPTVILQMMRPEEAGDKPLPVLLTIPGGGLFTCIPWNTDPKKEAEDFDCVSATFLYRTTFEAPFPAAINDCAAVYKYLVEHASELRIDPDRIQLHGESSGGHLALALCHRLKAHDYYGHIPCGVIARVPIVDERTIYPSSHIDNIGWGGVDVHISSEAWLHKNTNPARVPAEAFANHASVEECVGLPPTCIHTNECDPCSDPCMVYAMKLKEAGVYTMLHCWAGSEHTSLGMATFEASYDDPVASYGRRVKRVVDDEIRDFFTYDLTRR